jgi:class 3 adenylate cyclase/predicted ATPase
MDMGEWLRKLGLERYEQAFRENRIEADVLPSLTVEDLKDLGVALVGDRRRLLDAIAALRSPLPDPPLPGLVPGITGEGKVGADPATAPAAAPERRQLTVMFCDLVGSTPLAARLDPEDLRGILGAYHRCVAAIVEGFGGFVARYMGDGILAYFGYPRAHEDDAERAIRCGLAVADSVPRLNLAEELHARVGIATGLVVVGGEVVEHDVVGETPNFAARLQAMAGPDTVVVAASTRRLSGELFEYRDLGAIEVKGIAGRVPLWQVLRASTVASRFEALRGGSLSPLIGRDEEIGLLLRRWGRAKAGNGQVVLVSGEPGIGKSRIVAALAERLRNEPHLRLRYFCSPYHQDSSLFPFIEQLGRASGFARDDPPGARREKLEALLALAAPPDEHVALIADLLSLPASEPRPLPNLSPQRKKERTLEALIGQLEGLARQQPILMVFEDAHWIDPTSRELLDLTLEHIGSLPVLLIVTFRPEFLPPWTGQPQVTMLALNRLDRHDRTLLIEEIAGGKALPAEVVDQIADRTDGVPLFVEELTKSALEHGVPPLGIPATLHDSLMARLDRLPSVRLLAQIGAAIGREFPYALLRIVSRIPEDELRSALGRLVASGLVFQRGAPPDAVFVFKHALVQDVAHNSLLHSSRRQWHARIVAALEARSPDLIATQPELLAQHCAEAGLIAQSAAYWGKAGRRSAACSAMAEAAAQFQKGLDQLALLPETPERQQQELELRSGLGAALMIGRGYAAAETGHNYARARELWQQLGSPSEFLHVPWGQCFYHVNRCEFDLAQCLADDLLRSSRQHHDTTGLVLGHTCCGRTLVPLGKFGPARSHLEQALALYDPGSLRPLLDQLGIDPEVTSQTNLATTLFCLGFPDRALASHSAAVAAARRLVHPPSLALSLGFGAMLLSLAGDDAILGERLDELAVVVAEHDIPVYRVSGPILRGWTKVENGDVTEGMSLLRSGSTAYRAIGQQAWMPYFIALEAAACEIAGRVEEALALVDEALQIATGTGERWFAAELHRLKGQVLLRQGYAKAAEEQYRKALGIAAEQAAKMWELRAAVSLARLWSGRGRRTEARDLLAPVYGWFTEGFDTPDLKEAKAVLDELGGG